MNTCYDNGNNSKSRKYCSVPGCGARWGTMFSFPKDTTMRQRWKVACKIQRANVAGSTVLCISHFGDSDISVTPTGRKRLNRDAVPSLNLPDVVLKKSRRNCTIHGCRKGFVDDVTLHSFPRNTDRRKQWALACGMTEEPSRHTQLCSAHFEDQDFRTVNGIKILNTTAVPSVSLPSPSAQHCFSNKSRKWKVINSCCAKFDDCLGDTDEYNTEDSDGNEENACFGPIQSVFVYCGLQTTVLVQHEVQKVKSLMNDFMLACLRSDEKPSLYETVQSIRMEVSQGYSSPTGLLASLNSTPSPFIFCKILGLIKTESQLIALARVTFSQLACLTELLQRISPKSNQCPSLAMKERIVLTLSKLCSNLHFEVLSIYFGVSTDVLEQCFRSTIPLLALVLKPCIPWLSRQENLMTMPECFNQFRDTRLILDCIEIPVESPDCLRCLNQMYSHLRELSAVKILVGVSPSGLITFLSKGYGNQATCEKVFRESDLIHGKLLEPFKDAVITDKGLCIENCCELNNINIHFLKHFNYSFKRLKTTSDAKCHAEIARAQATLERVLKRMEKFKILSGKLAWYLVPHLDDICTVISGLVNLNSSIISNDCSSVYAKDCRC